MRPRVRNDIESQRAMPAPRISILRLVIAGAIIVMIAVALILARMGG